MLRQDYRELQLELEKVERKIEELGLYLANFEKMEDEVRARVESAESRVVDKGLEVVLAWDWERKKRAWLLMG